ncbi:hypothetical protein DL96DRAFT_1795821 [Flagelloscypha sp. PMI_526]|nr:hypothetical protein DL96DRAFT_1795821 [Flagelloscypha sp. PMI_526]
MLDEEGQKALIKLVGSNNITVMLEFASLAILVWDWFITFIAEVRYVWLTRWSLGKILFFLTRYLPLSDVCLSIFVLQLMNPTEDETACQKPYLVIALLDVIGILVAQSILILRTWAIYDRNKWLLLGLSGFAVILGIYGGIAAIIFVNTIVWAGPKFAGVRGCNIITVDNRLVSGSYVGVMIFETTVFVATMVRALQRRRHSFGSRLLIEVIFRDGLIFYLFIVSISILNVVVMYATSQEYTVVLVIFQRVMHSVGTGRILLHMRKRGARSQLHVDSDGHRTEAWEMNTYNRPPSTVRFAPTSSHQTIMQQLETHLATDDWFVDDSDKE